MGILGFITHDLNCMINTVVCGDHAYCGCPCHPSLPAIPPSRTRRQVDDLENPVKTCPKCGYTAREMDGFSLLAAGFNGIKEGDPDDVDQLECGKCGQRFEPLKHTEDCIRRWKWYWTATNADPCETCRGKGGKVIHHDPSEAGVSLGPGTMKEWEDCPTCYPFRICPRCKGCMPGTTCYKCGYDHERPGHEMLEPEDVECLACEHLVPREDEVTA
jgi:hypothetical protein